MKVSLQIEVKMSGQLSNVPKIISFESEKLILVMYIKQNLELPISVPVFR